MICVIASYQATRTAYMSIKYNVIRLCISANLVAGTHGYANSHIATQYRIRKLTPRECGRLMGVSDEDIDKMAAVNSNTQLYKQFGNSIVVDVLCDIFKQLNIEQDKEN